MDRLNGRGWLEHLLGQHRVSHPPKLMFNSLSTTVPPSPFAARVGWWPPISSRWVVSCWSAIWVRCERRTYRRRYRILNYTFMKDVFLPRVSNAIRWGEARQRSANGRWRDGMRVLLVCFCRLKTAQFIILIFFGSKFNVKLQIDCFHTRFWWEANIRYLSRSSCCKMCALRVIKYLKLLLLF